LHSTLSKKGVPAWTTNKKTMDAFVDTVKQLGWRQAQHLLFTAAVKPTVEYTIKACSRLLKGVDDKATHAELKTLQKALDGKVKVGGTYFTDSWKKVD
jgi:hypothetical protein